MDWRIVRDFGQRPLESGEYLVRDRFRTQGEQFIGVELLSLAVRRRTETLVSSGTEFPDLASELEIGARDGRRARLVKAKYRRRAG